MNCFQTVIARLGLHAQMQGEQGFLFALLTVADGTGSDVHSNAAREAVRRLRVAGVDGWVLRRVEQMLNSLATAIDEGR